MNGRNDWGVKFGSIKFLEDMLRGHKNVARMSREHDVLFNVARKAQEDELKVLLVDLYVFGEAHFFKAQQDFPDLSHIAQAGKWAKFTSEARAAAALAGVRLSDLSDLYACLFRDDSTQ